MKPNIPGVFIALDGLGTDEMRTLEVARKLAAVAGNFGFKINLDYALKVGLTAACRTVQGFARPLFVDLKMWNGERTMVAIAKILVDLRVDYINVHALAEQEIAGVAGAINGANTRLLGLTVLSHYGETYCKQHFSLTLPKAVEHFANTAWIHGCDGIILPGTQLLTVKNVPAYVIKVATGIRPDWYKDDRHAQEITPAAAVAAGADWLVVGGPIMKAPDPVEALQKILAECQAVPT